MSAYFKMTCKGLDLINRTSLSDPAHVLLSKILYQYGQAPLTMEQLFDYQDTERKTAARLLYKMLHSGWLTNIDENEFTVADNKKLSETLSLQDIVNNDQIILSDQRGLVISTLGFSSEQSINLAANAAELLKKYPQKLSASNHEETLFPVFTSNIWSNMELAFRRIQVNGLGFIITTKNRAVLNNESYFELIVRLLRRYGYEH